MKVALDGSFDNDGAALGDNYSNFENIVGSRAGDDFLQGNAGANSLLGGGGSATRGSGDGRGY